MKLILLGAPGAGKGTHAAILSNRLSAPVISTGNILKEAVAGGTELGRAAKEYLDKGLLVADDVIIGILSQRIMADDCASGFILDGVPRTVVQARALDAMGVVVDKVISMEISDDMILERITGRRSCPACNASYHLTDNPPVDAELCDSCGQQLIIRTDDREEIVRKRLQVYHDLTEPLKEFYGRKGNFYTVDSSGEVSNTTRNLLRVLEL